MSLKKPSTWDEPDDTAQTTFTTSKGRVHTVHIESWHDMLVRGKRGLPMHHSPFTLVRIRVLNDEGQAVYARPIWLLVFGQRREALTLGTIWEAYGQRYDVEHFFRFGKQHVLMDAYQTPDTEHEENWWTIVQLAYVQLWFARKATKTLPRPWERYLTRFRGANIQSGPSQSAPVNSVAHESLPEVNTSPSPPLPPEQRILPSVASPSDVQRDCGQILQHIGTPARPPKPRGKAHGRRPGEHVLLRVRVPIVKKSLLSVHQEQAQQRAQQQRAP